MGWNLPKFPYTNGWLGADAAYSVSLGDGRSLWLFGDTFIGAAGSKTRRGSKMINNSIGISKGGGNVDFAIQYYWRASTDASAAPFFDNGLLAVWPLDGFLHNGKLYLALLEVDRGGENPFDFAPVGVLLAEVNNFKDADPLKWKINFRRLSSSRTHFPGSSIVVDKDFAYLFAFQDARSKTKKITLSRLPLSKLDKPAENMEHLGPSGWSSKITAEESKVLFDDGTSEFSVRYNPKLKKWMAIYGGFPRGEIFARFASDLSGPWSSPKSIFDLRPYLKTNNVIAYAAKEHTQYSDYDHAQISLSFVCNSLQLEEVLDDLELYRPEVVQVNVD